jgi:hypothetical protein
VDFRTPPASEGLTYRSSEERVKHLNTMAYFVFVCQYEHVASIVSKVPIASS